MKSHCRHDQKRSVVIFLEPIEEGQLPCMTVSTRCEACGAPFEFVGIETGPSVILSEDRRTLRLSIAEATKWRVQ